MLVHQMYKSAIVVVTVIALLFGVGIVTVAGNNTTLGKIVERAELVAVVDASFPPIVYTDPGSGNIVGLAVDLLKGYADALGVKLTLVDTEWSGVLPALLSSKVDMVGCHLTRTVARTARVSFTDPFFLTGTTAVMVADAPFNSYADLNSRDIKIGVTQGNVYIPLIQEMFPEAQMLEFPSKAEWTEALRTGRIDAVIDAEVAAADMFKRYPGVFKTMPQYMNTETYGFASRLGDYALRDSLNLYFQEIKISGRYAEIYNKWMGKPWQPVFTGAGS